MGVDMVFVSLFKNGVVREPNGFAFGERNKVRNAGGSAVKDDRSGGDPSAQTKAWRSAEDGEEAAKGARASSLTARGSTPKPLNTEQHRQVAALGEAVHKWDGRALASALRPQR